MNDQTRFTALSGVCTVLVIVGALAASSFRAAISDQDEGLQSLSITTVSKTVGTDGSARLTAMGNYGTMEMPIQANWSVIDGEATLENCAFSKTCTVTVGKVEGSVTVKAEAEKKTATITLSVTTACTHSFSDAIPSWSESAICKLANKGVVKGYDNGKYGSGDPVTHGQLITLFGRVIGPMVKEPEGCIDIGITGSHYAFSHACLFLQQNWINTDFMTLIDQPAPRGTVASLINTVFGGTMLSAKESVVDTTVRHFEDIPMDSPFYQATAVSNLLGIMTGNPSGDFLPDAALNRAEVAVVVHRILAAIDDLEISTLQSFDADARHAAASVSSSASSQALSSVSSETQGSDADAETGEISLSQESNRRYIKFLPFNVFTEMKDLETNKFDLIVNYWGRPGDNMPVFFAGSTGTIYGSFQGAILSGPGGSYETMTKEGCEELLRTKSRGQSSLVLYQTSETLCFRGDEGHIGKVRKTEGGEPNLLYAVWKK
ncbi:hypothetical protein A3D11_03195 [Candidatus Peribacteria bacterium RIFCSPHIGHO2_02_FULL_49_16]|nr:MAG: hypothetical protein A2880_03060 [Candidatus Peribacteria bacterium RIFCSPHIGHO2_01_FULL_49_38]OGJ59323.1 MAG: hypothetical protein A3D11_03195 [Candidatus Peribacteria bacterium RIFCSPHIGHO2_02_FULL_49_16]